MVFLLFCTSFLRALNLLLIAVLQKGLKSNFDEVEVNVVTSPDLTEEPFNLASEGNQMH